MALMAVTVVTILLNSKVRKDLVKSDGKMNVGPVSVEGAIILVFSGLFLGVGVYAAGKNAEENRLSLVELQQLNDLKRNVDGLSTALNARVALVEGNAGEMRGSILGLRQQSESQRAWIENLSLGASKTADCEAKVIATLKQSSSVFDPKDELSNEAEFAKTATGDTFGYARSK